VAIETKGTARTKAPREDLGELSLCTPRGADGQGGWYASKARKGLLPRTFPAEEKRVIRSPLFPVHRPAVESLNQEGGAG